MGSLIFSVLLMSVPAAAANGPGDFTGEKISYNIKKTVFKAGEATLEFKGKAEIDGQPVYLIVFTATSFNFYDQEKIYVDRKAYRPVVVKRDLNIFGKKEKIIEYYDRQKGEIRIVKNPGAEAQIQTIHKDGAIENIYGFIYRYRKEGSFQIGEKINLNLPTTDVTVVLKKKDAIRAGGERRDAYFMTSGDYRIWFGTGEDRVPLRIDGAMGLLKAALVLDEYQHDEKSDGTGVAEAQDS